MTENSNKTRDQAEYNFRKTQTQAMALNRITSEHDAAIEAREAKTARLREMRLQKEAEGVAQAVVKKPASKTAGKR